MRKTNERIFQDSVEKLNQWSGNNGIKLVRGAYLSHESTSKTVKSKQETDDNYDTAVEQLITMKPNSVILATHNHRSVVKAVNLLRDNRIASGHPRTICFGQLYGMRDDITYSLVRQLNTLSPHSSVTLAVVKCIPYGPLNEVIPYLVRRAEENRGILGGSILEREILYSELKTRFLRQLGIIPKESSA
jgi:proline dehydrogenase